MLVLRALGLGDAVTAVPALRGLRRAWPGRPLVLGCRPAIGAWLRGLGLVDDVVPVDGLAATRALDQWRDDEQAEHVAVNLHGKGPQSHLALLRTGPSALVAYSSPDLGLDGPAWDADEHEVDRWCRLVESVGGRCGREDLRLAPRPRPRHEAGYVVVHPGAASGSRQWPVERFRAVVDDLVRSGHRVVVTGSASERPLTAAVAGEHRTRATGPSALRGPRAVDAAGSLTLPDLADVVSHADLVVSGDTGVAHLATAYERPSVVLFGPTPPRLWGPAIDPALHTVLWHGDETFPGSEPGDPHGTVLDPALAAVTVAEVLAGAERLLVGSRVP
ncbi:glycosyltransferase family 9 protein [Oerskovia sp. USHLN155]|uniref:glycosyltransferase family 9 protein n=1 Tax=Oerskovia sp. USHLN155 TaxID=3081288 RepID=UPI00301A6E0B